jgi:hypothetical protein
MELPEKLSHRLGLFGVRLDGDSKVFIVITSRSQRPSRRVSRYFSGENLIGSYWLGGIELDDGIAQTSASPGLFVVRC